MSSVLKISEAASLALHTMVFLAENSGRKVSTKEIAAALGKSEFHLSKVLQRLARTGLVKSVRGPKGGFVLAEGGEEITLLEVYEALEGPLDSRTCILGTPVCGRKACILGELTWTVNQHFRDHTSGRKLRDLKETGGEGSTRFTNQSPRPGE